MNKNLHKLAENIKVDFITGVAGEFPVETTYNCYNCANQFINSKDTEKAASAFEKCIKNNCQHCPSTISLTTQKTEKE